MDELPPISLDEVKARVVSDDVCEYINYAELNVALKRLKAKSDEAVAEFSEVLQTLVDELSRITNDPMLVNNRKTVLDFIRAHPKRIMDNFIIKCYNYQNGKFRAKIIEGDDAFFMTNSLEEISDGQSGFVDIVFQFRNFWGKLNADNREIIKTTLMALCALCDVRYVNFNKYLVISDMNQRHKKILAEFKDF